MKKLDERSKNWIKVATIIIIIFVAALNIKAIVEAFEWMLGVCMPVVIGGIIAFILYLPMNAYLKLLAKCKIKWIVKSKEVISIVLSIVSVTLVIAAMIAIVVPQVVNTFGELSVVIPKLYDDVYNWTLEHQESMPFISDIIIGTKIDWSEVFSGLFSFFGAGEGGVLLKSFNLVSLVIGGLYQTIMAIIISIYLLIFRRQLQKQFVKFSYACLPDRVNEFLFKLGMLSKQAFSQYIVGKCLDATALGLLTFLGMMIFQFPNAAMISVIIGVTALIPIIGAYIGLAVGAILILVVDPMQALWFVIFMFILQLLENNLVYPKIIGETVGLPAVWIIIAITVGGGLGGFFGMLFGVPIASVIYTMTKDMVDARLWKRKTKVIKEVQGEEIIEEVEESMAKSRAQAIDNANVVDTSTNNADSKSAKGNSLNAAPKAGNNSKKRSKSNK